MSIHLLVYELEGCSVLESGAGKSVFPLCQYNTITQMSEHYSNQPLSTLIGIGPGDIPVLWVAHVPVQINNPQVSLHFPIADIACEETLQGHPFLTLGQARLDFGNHRIVLFKEVHYFHVCKTRSGFNTGSTGIEVWLMRHDGGLYVVITLLVFNTCGFSYVIINIMFS